MIQFQKVPLDDTKRYIKKHNDYNKWNIGRKNVTKRGCKRGFFVKLYPFYVLSNPCPCGYLGDSVKQCTCRPFEIARYQRKISGPLLDRIDLQVYVPRVEYKALSASCKEETSAQIRERVCAARMLQLERLEGSGNYCNAAMNHRQVVQHCRLNEAGNALLEAAFCKLGLSARSYDRLLKVARTIADLAGSEVILPDHIAEAIQLRTNIGK